MYIGLGWGSNRFINNCIWNDPLNNFLYPVFTTSLKSTLNVFVCNYFSVLQNVQINKTAITTKITRLSLKCESRINISAHKHVVSSFMCLCDDVCISTVVFECQRCTGTDCKEKIISDGVLPCSPSKCWEGDFLLWSCVSVCVLELWAKCWECSSFPVTYVLPLSFTCFFFLALCVEISQVITLVV